MTVTEVKFTHIFDSLCKIKRISAFEVVPNSCAVKIGIEIAEFIDTVNFFKTVIEIKIHAQLVVAEFRKGFASFFISSLPWTSFVIVSE